MAQSRESGDDLGGIGREECVIRIYSKNTILFNKEKNGPEAQCLGVVTALPQDLDLLYSTHIEAHGGL